MFVCIPVHAWVHMSLCAEVTLAKTFNMSTELYTSQPALKTRKYQDPNNRNIQIMLFIRIKHNI